MIRSPDLFISSGAHDRAAVDYLNNLFGDAARRGSGDVHMKWNEGRLVIKIRLAGKLQPYDVLDVGMAKVIDEKLRARANMSAADRNITLDGRMSLRFPDRVIDVRMSLIPTHGGQKLVCRLLDQSNAAKGLDSIEMTPMVRRAIKELIGDPNGLFIVVGPTGSGKTTTLYALIKALNNGERNILTLENPVESVIEGIDQVNIDQHLSFAAGLRAGLRQDPDVILVGEIRDHETAMIAIQAANTGHLVLTTLHANSAALAITRLTDMGVDPHTLAACLRGVMAQRLVQRITNDSEPAWEQPNEAEKLWLAKHGMQDVAGHFPVVADESKYRGQVPVIEMIRADSAIRASIVAQAGEMKILNAAARQSQFETLAQAGARMAAVGYTTLREVKSIVSDDAVASHVKRVGDALIDMGVLTYDQVFEAVEMQMELLEKGFVRRLGEIVVEQGLCSIEQLVQALGVTAGAPTLLEAFVRNGRLTQEAFDTVVARWSASMRGTNLFTLCDSMGLVSKEEFNEPSIVFQPGSGLHLAAIGSPSAAGQHSAVPGSVTAG